MGGDCVNKAGIPGLGASWLDVMISAGFETFGFLDTVRAGDDFCAGRLVKGNRTLRRCFPIARLGGMDFLIDKRDSKEANRTKKWLRGHQSVVRPLRGAAVAIVHLVNGQPKLTLVLFLHFCFRGSLFLLISTQYLLRCTIIVSSHPNPSQIC